MFLYQFYVNGARSNMSKFDDWDDFSNYCPGDCDLVGPRHSCFDCIYVSPRTRENARCRKVQDLERFEEQLAMCGELLFHTSGKSSRLLLKPEDAKGYVTVSLADFEKCFGVTELHSLKWKKLIGCGV